MFAGRWLVKRVAPVRFLGKYCPMIRMVGKRCPLSENHAIVIPPGGSSTREVRQGGYRFAQDLLERVETWTDAKR